MKRFVGLISLLALFLLIVACSHYSVSPSAPNNNSGPVEVNVEQSEAWRSLQTFATEGCVFQDPPIKGSTNQGGYSFEYESRSGTGPSGACRWYRLRNTPGRLYTPVKWYAGNDIWFDTALAGCSAGSTCPWIDVVKQSLRAVDGRSALSYGVNKNEFSDDPSAFQRHPDEKSVAQTVLFTKFVTTVSGVIADAEGKPVPIAVRVVSSVNTGSKPYSFAYEIQTGPIAGGLSVDLANRGTDAPLRVNWGVTSSESFRTAAAEEHLTSVGSPQKVAVIDFSSPSLSLEFEEKLIISQGGTSIFTTTAPAYRPQKE